MRNMQNLVVVAIVLGLMVCLGPGYANAQAPKPGGVQMDAKVADLVGRITRSSDTHDRTATDLSQKDLMENQDYIGKLEDGYAKGGLKVKIDALMQNAFVGSWLFTCYEATVDGKPARVFQAWRLAGGKDTGQLPVEVGKGQALSYLYTGYAVLVRGDVIRFDKMLQGDAQARNQYFKEKMRERARIDIDVIEPGVMASDTAPAKKEVAAPEPAATPAKKEPPPPSAGAPKSSQAPKQSQKESPGVKQSQTVKESPSTREQVDRIKSRIADGDKGTPATQTPKALQAPKGDQPPRAVQEPKAAAPPNALQAPRAVQETPRAGQDPRGAQYSWGSKETKSAEEPKKVQEPKPVPEQPKEGKQAPPKALKESKSTQEGRGGKKEMKTAGAGEPAPAVKKGETGAQAQSAGGERYWDSARNRYYYFDQEGNKVFGK
jgi:hypothetical protein